MISAIAAEAHDVRLSGPDRSGPTVSLLPGELTAPPVMDAPVRSVTRGAAENADLPYWPSPSSIVTSPFGDRLDPVEGLDFREHEGVDIRAAEGSVVIAADDGRVELATWTPRGGLIVRLAHSGGYSSSYAHLSRIDVKEGQELRAGERLGLSGATGRVTGPHLHFTVRHGVEAIDPVAFRYRPYLAPHVLEARTN